MSEASQGFFRRHWLATVGVAAGIVIPSLWLYLQLVVWKRHGDDLMLTAFGIIVTVLLWCLLLAGIVKYRNNSKHDSALEDKVNALTEENQTLRDEITARDSEAAIRRKEQETERLKPTPPGVISLHKCPHLLNYETLSSPVPGYYVGFGKLPLSIQAAKIRNVELDDPVTANNVKAKIEYRHKNGRDVFVIHEAVWLGTFAGDESRSGMQTRLFIRPNAAASLLLVCEDSSEAKGKWVVTELASGNVKSLTAGRWDVKIEVTADNCDPYIGTGGFTIHPGNNQIVYDTPALSFSYERKV